MVDFYNTNVCACQIASAIHYLHEKSIIYRDLKTDNILVWTFPEPRDPIPIQLGSNLGVDTVLVKLSDYGISQYVAKQGALGYVGTPGFIAPEILKYHGKEVRKTGFGYERLHPFTDAYSVLLIPYS